MNLRRISNILFFLLGTLFFAILCFAPFLETVVEKHPRPDAAAGAVAHIRACGIAHCVQGYGPPWMATANTWMLYGLGIIIFVAVLVAIPLRAQMRKAKSANSN